MDSPEQGYPVTVREIDWTKEVIKAYGPKWNEPEIQYVFSNGRTFKFRTQEDIYEA